MKWEQFLARVRDLPVIEPESLTTSDSSIRVQISRWEKALKRIYPSESKSTQNIYRLRHCPG